MEKGGLKKKISQFFNDKSMNKEIIIPILVIIIYLIIFIQFGLKGFFVHWASTSSLQTKIKIIEQQWANIDSHKQEIKNANQRIEYYREKRLPGEKEIPALLKYLSNLAN